MNFGPPVYTVSAKAIRLVAEISAALERYSAAHATLKDAQRLRRIGPDKGGHWEVAR